MLDRVQDFSKLALSRAATSEQIQDSFRAAPPAGHGEPRPRLLHLDWAAAGTKANWRGQVRERMNAISDEIGLPRVIVMAPAPLPLAGVNRSLAAHVDHAVAWLDEFLADSGAGLRKTLAGSQFAADVTRLRSSLSSCAVLAIRRRYRRETHQRPLGEEIERLQPAVRAIVRLDPAKQNPGDAGVATAFTASRPRPS